jgi:hypothetical protein
MATYLEDLSGVLQNFGVVGIALLAVPVLVAVLARNVTSALSAGLLSFAAFMLLVAPVSAVSGIAILSGLGSFVVALDSIVARRRMVAVDRDIADLTSRLTQLEAAERRRLALEVAQTTKRRGGRRGQPIPSSASVDMAKVWTSLAERTEPVVEQGQSR